MDTGNFTISITCTDTDFKIAMEIVKVLIQHAAQIYQRLPTEAAAISKPSPRQKFYEQLPDEDFNFQQYIDIAQQSNIQKRSAIRYIARFIQTGLLQHPTRDTYNKTK
ncbi:hypothetical protein FACS1894199_08270 [Bacteroidia bacterium]|nr:hypothetical protein FACS1894199_08270 [Bacteroidia bacterium]